MPSHVITARIYTGHILFLGRIESGKLGDWYASADSAIQVNTETEIEHLFNALCAFVTLGTGKTLFAPGLMDSLRKRARMIEVGTACLEPDLIHQRRKYLDISGHHDHMRNTVLKLAAA